MRDKIKEIITEIYLKNNSDIFMQGCRKKIEFLEELLDKINMYVDTYEVYSRENEPAEEIRISINSKKYYEICINYNSILCINKIAKFYYLQHEFSIDNPDDEAITPCLDGFGYEAYSKKQFCLDEIIVNYLSEQGYERLGCSEMDEIFPKMIKPNWSEMPEYFTVNNALFMDYFGFFE